MKLITVLILCFCFLCSLFACASQPQPEKNSLEDSSSQGGPAPGSDTDAVSDASSDTLTDSATEDGISDAGPESDVSSDDVAGQPPEEPEETLFHTYEATLEHRFITTDIINFSLVVYDLNQWDRASETLDDSAIIWEWRSREDPNCFYANKIIRSISGVKFRYSEYYGKDVVVACANFGWVGVIDYEACSLLWECELPTGPHSVEMLPNGDVVVGSADGEGALYYFPLSAGETDWTCSVESPACHGVCWDPEKEWLWVLELEGVSAFRVDDVGSADGELIRLDGHGAKFSGDSGGHAFAPIAGTPGKYWVSAGKLWVFDSKTETLTRTSRSDLISGGIKGVCSFSDQTVVLSVAGLQGQNVHSWGSDGFKIVFRELSSGKVKLPRDQVITVSTPGREFYKIQAFSKKYQ